MKWCLRHLEETLLIGSTLVEGSTLTEDESKKILAGQTVQGHHVSKVRELINYQSATSWLITELEQSPFLSRKLILDFHKRLFYGISNDAGTFKQNSNYVFNTKGEKIAFAKPGEVSLKLDEWVVSFNTKSKRPGEKNAAKLYYDFALIHPFSDGNGRIGRILIAYWVFANLKKSFHFFLKDKIEHLQALEMANRGNFSGIESFFRKRIK